MQDPAFRSPKLDEMTFDERDERIKELEAWLPSRESIRLINYTELGPRMFHRERRKRLRAELSILRRDASKRRGRSPRHVHEVTLQKSILFACRRQGYNAEREVRAHGSSRRCDVYFEIGQTRFVVECKRAGNADSMDQAIGQVLTMALLMGAVPVIATPTDAKVNKDSRDTAIKAGILMTTERSIVDEIERYMAGVKSQLEIN